MNSVLRLDSVNGSPIVEYRDIDMVTIQRRTLTPDGDEYRDGASQWGTITIGDVLAQLRLNGQVAEWMRTRTRVDCSPKCFARYPDLTDSAYLWNVNAGRG